MKIEIEIPDRYKKRNLYLFAGLEPIWRYLQSNRYEEIKSIICSKCGKCCESLSERHRFYSENGCIHLLHSPGQQLCGLDILRPHDCSKADGLHMGITDCTVRWEKR